MDRIYRNGDVDYRLDLSKDRRGKFGVAIAALLVGACAILASLKGCKSGASKFDQQARDALLILEKLAAKVETGIVFRDYSVAVGEANFVVGQFLEGESANWVPGFSNSLRTAMKWYEAAERVWSRKAEAATMLGYCNPDGLPGFQVKDLCDAYPELVLTVPGKGPSPGNSTGFAVAQVNFYITLEEVNHKPGDEITGSPGLIYELAIQDSWRRASLEVSNGKSYLAGDIPKITDGTRLKTDSTTELKYLIDEVNKRIYR